MSREAYHSERTYHKPSQAPIRPHVREFTWLPTESEGACQRCRRWNVLGDGFCQKCWDFRSASYKAAPPRDYRRNVGEGD